MPPLEQLAPARLDGMARIWMLALWAYLVLACAMVVLRVVQVALGQG
jgi:hypothetical protein